jgi:hypothetical protein
MGKGPFRDTTSLARGVRIIAHLFPCELARRQMLHLFDRPLDPALLIGRVSHPAGMMR